MPAQPVVLRRFLPTLLLIVGLASAPLAVAAEGLTAAEKQALPSYFGFGPLEIFKVEDGITQLRPADFNGDGRTDFVVANNGKSTLEVFLQRSEAPADEEAPVNVNDLKNHWRFEDRSVSVRWRVDSLQAKELTGDDAVDLVFFGDPAELVVLPGKGDGSFGEPITFRVRDGLRMPGAVVAGDVNGDKRCDVILLAEKDFVIFYQREKGGLAAGKRSAHALEDPVALDLADLNGDERLDLIVLTRQDDYPLHVRYQDSLGHLGPMQRLKLPGLRSGLLAPSLGRQQADLFAVERVSGRLKRWTFEDGGASDPNREAAVLYYPIPGKSQPERLPLTVGDVDGDKALDVISADVDSAQLALYRRQPGVGLLPVELFGGQMKMRDMVAYDADGDGADEVYVLSPDEEIVACSKYHEGRLSFPKAMPTKGKPYALAVGTLSDDGPATLCYVAKNSSSDYELVLHPLSGGQEPTAISLDDLDDPPSALHLADVNRDGATDVLIFVPYAPLMVLIQQADGSFTKLGEEGDAQDGLVKKASPAGYAYVDADGDGSKEVLLTQGAFVRALKVNEAGQWEILDQYNVPGVDAELTGVTAYFRPGAKRPELAMYDTRTDEVRFFLPHEGGTFKLDRSVAVGAFDLKAMQAAPLGADEAPAILLADSRRVALVLPDTPAPRAVEQDAYESSVEDARLAHLAAGDLNHDGRTDVAVIEFSEHFVEILTFGPNEQLVRGNRFRVFAKKQYQYGEEGPEPRWIEIVDLTADGIDDLVLIAHDRVLLYPGQ